LEEATLKTLRAIGAVALLLVVNGASAHAPSQPPHQLYNEDDLKLESGEVMEDFSISHVTHGDTQRREVECHPDGHGDQRQSSPP
jgi:hypothetical protein